MSPIDYDQERYRDYPRGRALSERQLQAWIDAAQPGDTVRLQPRAIDDVLRTHRAE